MQPLSQKEAHRQQRRWHQFLSQVTENYTFLFLFLTLISFCFSIFFGQGTLVEKFLLSFLTWGIGVRCLVAALAHSIPSLAAQIANSYGWPVGGSFQREIATAEAAFGILGIGCFWIRGDFWTATILATGSCWFLSELGGMIRIRRLKQNPDYKMNASLLVGMRVDLTLSILLFICLTLWKLGF